jgi:alkyl sulfatase BDS1-like metallo-beta-lactamase superfamily hydrolase
MGEFVDKDVTATIRMSKKDLDRISLGQAKLEDLIKDGTIQIEGDQNAYLMFLSKMGASEFWFPVATP